MVNSGIGMTSARTRERLITRLRQRGIQDQRVIDAIRQVPRHAFIDEALSTYAYEDKTLPIGHGQTISEPYVVALMTQTLLAGDYKPKKVLEVGTGSGYQAAILSLVSEKVFSVERIGDLLKQARRRFRALKMRNISIRHADGHIGWHTQAPFDAIIMTCAGEILPPELLEQLADGGRLVAPIGPSDNQALWLYYRNGDKIHKKRMTDVKFVPLRGGTL